MKTTQKIKIALVALLVAVISTAVFLVNKDKENKEITQRETVELSGAGATFPLPFYNMVFEKYSESNNDKISYGAIGSGGGIRSLKDGIVDFAGSDAFLSDKEMSEMQAVIHIPTCMGAVVLSYNLPGIEELKLSGSVVADIFAGKIKKWNDERIAVLNAGLSLPDAEIIPVYRSDGSGTTANFTDYLSKVSESWKQNYGAGKSVNFPVGQAAKGNPGVASVISQTPNSIGYVGSEYAFAQNMSYATIQNVQGEFVKPTAESISKAASADIPEDTRISITNSAAQGAYPISCFTWLIVYQEQGYSNRTIDQAKATVELLQFMLADETQKITSEVHYAPLPKRAVELSLNNLKKITYNGSPLK